jgi:hypothetical protein
LGQAAVAVDLIIGLPVAEQKYSGLAVVVLPTDTADAAIVAPASRPTTTPIAVPVTVERFIELSTLRWALRRFGYRHQCQYVIT